MEDYDWENENAAALEALEQEEKATDTRRKISFEFESEEHVVLQSPARKRQRVEEPKHGTPAKERGSSQPQENTFPPKESPQKKAPADDSPLKTTFVTPEEEEELEGVEDYVDEEDEDFMKEKNADAEEIYMTKKTTSKDKGKSADVHDEESDFSTIFPESDPVPQIVPDKVYVHRKAPLDGDCMTVTWGPTGERCYLRKANKSVFESNLTIDAYDAGSLLATPFDVILDRVDRERVRKAMLESELDKDKQSDLKNSNQSGGSSGDLGGQLWVNKYAPKKFMDLLSDEKTNREVLRWVKQWDPLVFGTTSAPSTSPSSSSSSKPERKVVMPLQNANAIKTKGMVFGSGTRQQQQQASAPMEVARVDHRPEPRVILLCGPPGLGKTTLAHIIAQHAGYRPYEINASDDRSSDSLKKRILDATEMKSMFGDNRPNCVIIDEIDGALEGSEGKGAISTLMKIISGGDKKTSTAGASGGKGDAGGEEEENDKADGAEPLGGAGGKKGGGKKGKGKDVMGRLCRPIICICNDQYAQALRQLRQEALVFNFKRTSAQRLSHRLKSICRQEGMALDSKTLNTLCELTECDVRSCLNTLQFLKRRGNRRVNEAIIRSMALGQKDINKSLFSIWTSIFEMPRKRNTPMTAFDEDGFSLSSSSAGATSSRGGGGGTKSGQQWRFAPGAKKSDSGGQSTSRRMGEENLANWTSLYTMLASHSENDRILDGCHENFLSVRFSDTGLDKTVQCFEWMEYAETLNRAARSSQNYALLAYTTFAPMAIHYICRTSEGGRSNITFPRMDSEHRFKKIQNTNIVLAFCSGVTLPSLVRTMTSQSTILDLLPYLLQCISPPLKKANTQIMSEKERTEVKRVVDILISFGLTYKALYTPEGSYIHKLDPGVDQLSIFNSSSNGGKANILPPGASVLNDLIKKMMAHEVEMERMRRAESAFIDKENMATQNMSTPGKGKERSNLSGSNSVKKLAQKMFAKTQAKPEMPSSNTPKGVRLSEWTTGGSTKRKREEAALESGTSTVKHHVVLFKYHEGYTNAVRRTVLLKHLM
mmetsp:Transcript_46222/g.76990  ORF Transcript_46222/g.76990 Transcript_46222/m.76990 type:complete len:1050 (-) Transcript_46222:217-3366(-)